ncbi:MAG TPA: hypothetical protein VEG38_08395 [Acidimicrobiia bacterium]|nr:hypothetical protein [Acidimicrobiia bacterium]
MYRRILFAAAASAIGLAACGGSSENTSDGVVTTTTVAPTTTTTLPPITKAAYVQQGNAICQVMNDKNEALADPGEDLAKMVSMMEQSRQITADALAQLRDLRMPAGDEAALGAIFGQVDTVISDADQAIAALRAGQLENFLTIAERLEKNQQTVNDASIAFGLNVCGE